MKKFILLLTFFVGSIVVNKSYAQNTGMYAFARTADLFDYNFSTQENSYIDGVSAGVGWFHKSLFLELGAIIFEGNSHAYYTYFGKTLNSVSLGNNLFLNTSWFGEIANIPIKSENDIWGFTSGLAIYPNVQLNKVNVGVAINTGINYKKEEFIWNNRMVLNLTYRLF